MPPMAHPTDRDDHNIRRTAPWRCLLCRSEEVSVETIAPEFVIDCRTCGAKVAYLPHPPDAPHLAGRIELLVEPFATRARTDSVPAGGRDRARAAIGRV
jgi:DNA-directed RNA polymerase subunit RPC12/RpoP